MALNAKQAAFVREYLIDHNATQAAIRAGYSAKTAGQIAHNLLKKAEVAQLLSQHEKAATEEAVITKAEVLRGLKKEAEQAENDNARVSAWGLLGRHLELFTDKTKLQGADGGPVQVSIAINGVRK